MQGVRTAKMAQLMGVTPQTIRKYVRNNSIPFHELPSGQLLFTKEDQDTILRNKQTNPRTTKSTDMGLLRPVFEWKQTGTRGTSKQT